MDAAALKYAETPEWVALDGDVATVGITDFAVQQLTDLVYMDLPAVGTSVVANDTFGEVESVKAVSDLYAPVSGEIVEVNEGLPDDLAILSDDPFERGWIVKIRLSDPGELDGLMDAEAYGKHCESNAH